jgi:hypothetical protein
MTLKKELIFILIFLLSYNLFCQEKRYIIVEFRALTENDTIAKYMTNLFIEKINEIDSLSSISFHQQPTLKENDYATLKPLINKDNDFLITGDININDKIISVSFFVFDVKNDQFCNPINLITENNSTNIIKGIEKIVSVLPNIRSYPDPINIISLGEIVIPDKNGSIIFSSDIRKAHVFINDEYIGVTPFVKNVKFGKYKIKMVNPDYNISETFTYSKFSKNCTPIFRSLKPTWLNLNIFPEHANLFIDNQFIDMSDPKNKTLNSNLSKILIKKDGYHNKQILYAPKPYQFNSLDVTLKPKSKSRAILFSTLFPGTGQMYVDNKFRGLFFGLSEIFCISNSIISAKKMNDNISAYKKSQERYNRATEIDIINKQREIMLSRYDNIIHYEKSRNIYIASSIGVWLINLLEIFTWKEPDNNIKVSMKLENVGRLSPKIGFTYEF